MRNWLYGEKAWNDVLSNDMNLFLALCLSLRSAFISMQGILSKRWW